MDLKSFVYCWILLVRKKNNLISCIKYYKILRSVSFTLGSRHEKRRRQKWCTKLLALPFLTLFLFAFSCKPINHQKPDSPEKEQDQNQDKYSSFLKNNTIEIAGKTVIGKTQNEFDFSTKEEFFMVFL